jgi:hypothetical protein
MSSFIFTFGLTDISNISLCAFVLFPHPRVWHECHADLFPLLDSAPACPFLLAFPYPLADRVFACLFSSAAWLKFLLAFPA